VTILDLGAAFKAMKETGIAEPGGFLEWGAAPTNLDEFQNRGIKELRFISV
jgi:hypothetical protein